MKARMQGALLFNEEKNASKEDWETKVKEVGGEPEEGGVTLEEGEEVLHCVIVSELQVAWKTCFGVTPAGLDVWLLSSTSSCRLTPSPQDVGEEEGDGLNGLRMRGLQKWSKERWGRKGKKLLKK